MMCNFRVQSFFRVTRRPNIRIRYNNGIDQTLPCLLDILTHLYVVQLCHPNIPQDLDPALTVRVQVPV